MVEFCAREWVAGGYFVGRLPLPAAAIDRDFAAPAQPKNGLSERKNQEVPANALLAQLVEHFHGKEGVWGSSPQEGSTKAPVIRGFSVSGLGSGVSGGHKTDTFGHIWLSRAARIWSAAGRRWSSSCSSNRCA